MFNNERASLTRVSGVWDQGLEEELRRPREEGVDTLGEGGVRGVEQEMFPERLELPGTARWPHTYVRDTSFNCRLST
jgi:hypothetical protein